jgi:antitoxin HicB
MASVAAELERYLALPYTRELVPEDDGTWYARVLELPGCMTVGDTQAEALANLDDAMATWIEAKLEDRESIPEPAGNFSGRFVVRVPKTLHRDLVKAANRNGISLNQFIATTLAQAVGAVLSTSAR